MAADSPQQTPPLRPELSVVIPVYRSARVLPRLVDRLFAALDAITPRYEIVFVDDDSPDDSWHVLSRLQAQYPDRIVAVQLMRNSGQHNALMCGFRHAGGRLIVTMDDDLQNPPEEIHKLYETIRGEPFDLVYGVYESGKKHHASRNIGSYLVNFFFRIVFKSRIAATSFRIMNRELKESILSYSLNYTFVDGLLAWNTRRVGQVLVRHEARSEGRSGYSLDKLIALALNLFTNFSLLPLQCVSLIGLSAATGGFCIALYFLAQYFLRSIAVPGYASIIVSTFVLGGLQLLALGIMGEYLGRLHINVNRKPQYTERCVLPLRESAERLSVVGRAENGVGRAA